MTILRPICRNLGSVLRPSITFSVCFHERPNGRTLAGNRNMNDRLELLCAELRAIDYFEWQYRRATHLNDSDEMSHELRLERRERIVSEIQVICAKSGAAAGATVASEYREETPQADSNCSS